MQELKTRNGCHFIPDDINGFNECLQNPNYQDKGCPLAHYVLEGIIPADQITCTKHCPFPTCIITDSAVKQTQSNKAKVLRFGFRSGFDYHKVLSGVK